MTVVWDWNGTLLDDVSVCLAVMNDMLRRRGCPPLTLERYREIFTFPVRDYYGPAGLDLDAEPFEALAVEYMAGYREASRACGLVPGALETLSALDDMGAVQVLASASRLDDLQRQLMEQGLTGRFAAVLGMGDDLGGGKAGLAAAYLAEKGVDARDVWFVGDTLHDLEVARSIGCRCVLLSSGHQSRHRLESAAVPMLDTVRELPAFLAEQFART